MARRRRKPLLSDEQWEQIEPLLPPFPKSKKGGHPWAPNRPVLEGILWILRTGARWQDLPDKYPSPATCWRRLRMWEEQDVWLDIWRQFLSTLDRDKHLEGNRSRHRRFNGADVSSVMEPASVPGCPAREKLHGQTPQLKPDSIRILVPPNAGPPPLTTPGPDNAVIADFCRLAAEIILAHLKNCNTLPGEESQT